MPLGHQLSPCYFHPRSAISTHSTQNHTPDGLITPGHNAGRRFIFAWLKHCRHLHPSLAHHPSSLNSNAAGFLYSSLSHSLIIFIRLKHCRISLLFTHLKSQSVFSHSPSMTSTPGLSHRHTLTLPQLPTHSTRLIFEPSHTDSDGTSIDLPTISETSPNRLHALRPRILCQK
ncbi:hypothetical protein PGT21_020659 [Puccinia graminis f. sp. tritici]|uniref:Uncharacterized protein n=1 Tax=Puccinia graminis f. sp. tritici TaxID=56615 RepID=A0A5B0MP51_PUCGR|nr:hypothetical protein PGT21_020659 [Puccinia graminis f. sp. tritici]